jgi:hypothetical protein
VARASYDYVDTALITGSMLRECIKHPLLAKCAARVLACISRYAAAVTRARTRAERMPVGAQARGGDARVL